ncbi:unnamed protein product [Albugo candida]|uniref:Uncharacterized protein n=1 Tax=Albugo candida TaxID=65357 RepID=A0A024G4A8_9STRA|nr:unnamed protein product [Albugo candida]|eukprot:CCI41491.1 unnamed protein product [Albugo candida]
MHYPRLTWTILLWLSSYLFHHVSPVLQQAGMKLFYLEENNLEECTHCLLYGIGATRLIPTSLIPAEDARDSNVVEYKAIGSQFFFASASNFCQGRNMCINVETHNIHNIDEKGADLSSMPEKVSEITKKKKVCLIKSKASMNVLCAICLEEASGTQYFGQFHLLSYLRHKSSALLVMFSERTEQDIAKSCDTHCGTRFVSLKSPHCGHILTKLLQASDALPHSHWPYEGVQKITDSTGAPDYSITKSMLQNHYCLTTQKAKAEFDKCQSCLVRQIGGLIVADKTARLKGANDLHHIIHLFGRFGKKDKVTTECQHIACGKIIFKERDDPACLIQFHDIFVKPQEMKQITARKLIHWEKHSPEPTSPAVASECIWASKSEEGWICQSCLKRYSPKVMKLSEHATLATITSYTLKSSAAQCVDDSDCDQVVFVPFPICNYEILLQEEPAANDAHRRNILSGSISPDTQFQKTQLWESLHKNPDLESIYSQDTRIPKRTRVNPVGFDLNIPASMMELEQVAVVHWRSEEPWKCLECLAMKESVIMISIERSYAWVIDHYENLYRKGWKCPNCQIQKKAFSLSLDVRSMRSLSPIEIRNLYSPGQLKTKSKRGTSGNLPVANPEAHDTSVFLDGKQPNAENHSNQ